MSLQTNGTYLELGKAVATAYPLTFAAHFSSTLQQGNAQRTLISVSNSGDTRTLALEVHTTSGLVLASQIFTQAATVNSIKSNAAGWHHGAATFVSDTGRQPFLDGIPGAFDTTAGTTPSGLDRTNIGAVYLFGGISDQWKGLIRNAAIWQTQLSASEIMALAMGEKLPGEIRPGSLLMWLPLKWDCYDIAKGNLFTRSSAASPTFVQNDPRPLAARLGRRKSLDDSLSASTPINQEIGLATEADEAFAVTALRAITLGLADEADTAFAITSGRIEAIGLASEADSAFAIAADRELTLGLATETDIAFALTINRLLNLGLASEADTAFSLTVGRVVILGLALEHDVALPMRVLLIGRQRWLIRTAHLDALGEMTIDSLRLTVKRGIGSYDREPHIRMRVNRDNKGFGRWISRGLGLAGDRVTTLNFGGLGTAFAWQFEFEASEQAEIELQECEVIVTRLGH